MNAQRLSLQGKEKQLRDEKKQLRDKEKQLRDEKMQLREKENKLLDEKNKLRDTEKERGGAAAGVWVGGEGWVLRAHPC